MVPLTISAQNGIINQYDYFDKQIASLNLSNYYILRNGDFAYNKSYSNGYPYGTVKKLDKFEEGALSSLYICFKVINVDSNYLTFYFDSNKWNREVKLISGEGARNHGLLNLSPVDFFNIKLFISSNNKEQIKIAYFLKLLNRKIKLLSLKIQALKKYKEGLISRGLKLIIGNNKFVKFKSLFEEYNVKNEEDFLPYTVGKYGLKQIQDFNYNISNHKVFKPNSLLIGLGIEEIAFSTKTTGSVSPVYNVYSLKSCCDDSFVNIFLKPLLWIKKAFITKKSTRREFEIDKKALENMKIPYLNSNEIKYLCYSIKKVDKLIETLMDKKDKLDFCKKYLLEAMFI